MSAFAALRDGVRRVNGAPLLVVGLFLATLAVALPLSFAVRDAIEAHLGRSMAAETAAGGVNYDWWQEFSAQASGLNATLGPSIIGFGAVLDNVSNLADNLPMAGTLAAVTAAWLVVWSFLSGGAMDRLARQRATRTHGFFGACGVHFWRFLRLGIIAWLVYAALFGYVHGWIFESGYDRLTRDLTVERTAFLIRLAGYALFATLLVLCTIIFDYARVRIVVEDRRSSIGAVVSGARFAWRHAGQVAVLYLMNTALFMVAVILYALVAPGAGVSVLIALVVGEAYILARHYLKLVFYASEIALFQGALAHAAYTAAPSLVWPDSPAAESIVNAEPAAPRRV
jgi:hypothetical protein